MQSAPSSARARLDEVDARFLEIRRERPGIAGPIAVMAGGGGVALVSTYLAFVAWAYPGGGADDSGVSVSGAFTALAILGVAVGIGGLAWLVSRSKERSVYAPELRELKLQRRELLRELQLGFSSGRDRLGLTWVASF